MLFDFLIFNSLYGRLYTPDRYSRRSDFNATARRFNGFSYSSASQL